MNRPVKNPLFFSFIFLFLCSALSILLSANDTGSVQSLDEKVRNFLDRHRYSWRDMNVPETDGRILYDLVTKNNFTRALEIGTSTGHSAIWIAWALSKTGGRLTTIEIDEGRHREALVNFKEAGLSEFIDARLADAHELVEELEGPFDFVFIDADKDWYVNYARAIIPKLEAGGCIAAHNVRAPLSTGRRWRMGGGDYYEFMANQPGFETSIHPDSWSGLAISFKKRNNGTAEGACWNPNRQNSEFFFARASGRQAGMKPPWISSHESMVL